MLILGNEREQTWFRSLQGVAFKYLFKYTLFDYLLTDLKYKYY